ncbi:hypothetical protein [Kitasatospora arboriphila]|uniref:Uncharacterized protein n=1 Tax=Kitasatospora arboriphila TaxID=258052 RepID=A0ABN1U4I2_9ACTN
MSVVLVRVGHRDDRHEFVVERDGHAVTCGFRTEQSSLIDPDGVPLSVVVWERDLVAEFKETPDALRPLNKAASAVVTGQVLQLPLTLLD